MRFLILTILLFPLSVTASEVLVLKKEAVKEIERRIDSGILVGIVIGVIDSSGECYVSFGRTSLNTDRKPDKNTTFDIGSISKTFTTTILADMVAKDEISLNVAIKDYLPKKVSVPQLGDVEITPWHLATHTSGLPLRPYNVVPEDIWDTYGNYSVSDFYDALAGVKLLHDTGTKFSYSSFGTGVLAHILSLRSNADIESLISRRITSVLSMDNTSSMLVPAVTRNLAQGYSYHIPTLSHVNPIWPSLKSSASDMLRYIGANLGLVDSKLYQVMKSTHQVQVKEGVANYHQGMGWWVDDSKGKNIVLHNGRTHGYRSFSGFDSKRKRGVIVLSNSNGYIDDIGLQLLDATHKLWASKRPLSIALYEALKKEDFNKVISRFSVMDKKELKNYYINEAGLNDTGLFYVRKGDFNEGIQILKLASKLKSESANILDSLGWAYEKMGDKVNSSMYYKRALALDPDSWGTRERLRKLTDI